MADQNINYGWQTLRGVPAKLEGVPDSAARLQRQFGATLRAERQARKLTQQALAFEADLSLTYIGEIERGQRMVSIDTVRRLATALNLSAAELLARVGI